LNGPRGLAADALGNLYIADRGSNRVRRVSPEGTITTAAGSGADRYFGDGGLATKAGFTQVGRGLAVDAMGDLFIVDEGDYPRVRKVTPDGIITTIAGNGQPGFYGDNGKATDARLNFPFGLAVDSADNLFIADFDNYRVRKVSPEGTITTVAGNGKRPYAGDGGLATETGLRGPAGLAVDAAGNLLIADSGGAFHEGDGLPPDERVLKVYGVAAPGLLAGMPFSMPK
jgi:sugar lactone lactonase YvrE